MLPGTSIERVASLCCLTAAAAHRALVDHASVAAELAARQYEQHFRMVICIAHRHGFTSAPGRFRPS